MSSTQPSISAALSPPGRLTAIPSAIDSAERPPGRRADDRTRSGGRTPMIRTLTRASRRRRRRTTRRRRPGRPPWPGPARRSSSSSPSVPWPATIVRVVEGVDERQPARVRPLLGGAQDSWTRSPTDVDRRALAPGRLDLGDRRVAGMNTSHATPRLAAAATPAPARGCRPTPQTTPRAQPRLAERRELVDRDPRTLNEPVRCSDSHLKARSAPKRSLSAADGRTGVRRATPATAARARATSAAVGGRSPPASISPAARRPRRSRPARRAGAARRRLRHAPAGRRGRTPRRPH